jgi:hypothetical protein
MVVVEVKADNQPIIRRLGRDRAEGKEVSAPSSLSIFVLEDEALIRMMIVQMIEDLGHRVVAEAGSIAEALTLGETFEFDLAPST